ncbi:MAG: minor tail protein [Siphoviridae sp. ctvD11]|nr:MAG: minor tail protein [Siphoviridae sp. ctvD11]
MAKTITVAGTDRSSLVLWETLSWENAQTNEVDVVSFQVQKFGSRTFVPAILQEVIMNDGATRIFGGHIVRVDESIIGADRQVFTVTCKDYTHDMDRHLLVESYEDVPAYNVVCDLMNQTVNKDYRIHITAFENNEIWVGTGSAADTTNFRVGTQGLKLTSTGSNITAYRDTALDLQPTGWATTDYLELDIYVDDKTKLSSAVIKLGNADLSSYYSKDLTSVLVTGWNYVRVLISSFTTTGTPSWSAIAKIQVEADATGSDTVNVTFDNWYALKASGFTRTNVSEPGVNVEFAQFNYEYPSKCLQQLCDLFNWNWYVDENKDLHFFDKFENAAPFNLTDTGGQYIYNSLQMSDTGDQMRNSIYVRGGEYLGSTVNDNLTHQADGTNKIFKLGYKYANYSMTVNSVEKAIGLDNLDQYTLNEGIRQLENGVSALKLGDVTGNTKQSMQVICTAKARRSRVTLRIRKVGTPADNFTVQIFSDDGSNKPSVAKSTTVTLAGGSITTTFVDYNFTLTENATNSLLFSVYTKYHIVATRSGANDASNYYEIDVADKDAYDGISYAGDSTPTWTATNYDWYFIEYFDFDALYSFSEKIVTLNTAPGAGVSTIFTGDPYLPVRAFARDTVSIAAHGEFEFKIVDKTIKTKEAARQRAMAELSSWSNETVEGSFRTYEDGLRAGQTINIQSTIRGINEDCLIQRVTATARSSADFEYTVEVVTTRTLSMIQYLQNQLLSSDKEIVISDDEILEKYEFPTETITLTEVVTTQLQACYQYDGTRQYNGATPYC